MIDDEEMTGTGPIYDVAAARWGIAYHSSNSTPRSKRWYRVSRMVYADGGWFELYWHAEVSLRGLFHDMRASTCRRGGEMERTL
jgi:hypothetical protein